MKISAFYNHIEEAAQQTGLSVDQILAKLNGFGITLVELDDALITDAAALKQKLDAVGLGVSSTYHYYDLRKPAVPHLGYAQVDNAVALGCKRVMIVPGLYSEGADEKQITTERENVLHMMRETCQYAAERGVVPTIEDYDNALSPIATAEQMDWFAQRIPQLRITMDTGNFMYSAQSELDAYALFKGRIAHVHCKDRALTPGGGEPKADVNGRLMYPCAVGEGVIAMEQIVTDLVKSGYDDAFVIEHFGSNDHLGMMERSAKWLLEVGKKAQ